MTSVSFVRRKEVRISFALVQHVLTQGTELHARVAQGLPAGARLVRLYLDGADIDDTVQPTAEACLIFEHESFEPTALGERTPLLRVDLESTPPPPLAPERQAIRGGYVCSACGEPAYLCSLDFLSFPCGESSLFVYLPAGRPRYGCAQHPPRKEVVIQCASKGEAEALLLKPLDLNARIVDAARLGAQQ